MPMTRAEIDEILVTTKRFVGAILTGADMRGADLTEADLFETILTGADLFETILRGADMRGAILTGAILTGARNIPASVSAALMVAPEVGSYQGWKKLAGGHVAHLEIPEHAARSSATTRKCRASEARVLAIYDRDGNPVEEPVPSLYTLSFLYQVGEIVRPSESFDPDRWNECSTGIHHFITRREAEDWT